MRVFFRFILFLCEKKNKINITPDFFFAYKKVSRLKNRLKIRKSVELIDVQVNI